MPSEKILEKKKQAVQGLTDKLSKASAGVLVDYRGLTVEEDTELRKKLREAEVEYKVVKNTLTRFASKEVGLDELDPILHGPTSMALSYDDPIAPAKILYKFSEEHENLEIKAGFIEGKVVNFEEVKKLAKLPSREQLVAMALRGLNAPITGFVNVLNANLRGLAVALNAIKEKKEQEA